MSERPCANALLKRSVLIATSLLIRCTCLELEALQHNTNLTMLYHLPVEDESSLPLPQNYATQDLLPQAVSLVPNPSEDSRLYAREEVVRWVMQPQVIIML